MCPSHEHVLLEREYQCFSMEVDDGGCLCATGCALKRSILDDL